MSWIDTEGHTCDKPDDWATYPVGAVWKCPVRRCGQEWEVKGWRSTIDSGHSLRFVPRQPWLARMIGFVDD